MSHFLDLAPEPLMLFRFLIRMNGLVYGFVVILK